MFEKCYCGTGKIYSNCCKPYITGRKIASVPEILMRSRYTAYVIHAIDYIVESCFEKDKSKINRNGIIEWSKNSKWLGLEIIFANNPSEEDKHATVEFKAVYERLQLKRVHHEIAEFEKRDGRWFYRDGRIISVPVTRSDTKVGRNDPCPCRSGKKYKKCCGS
jgi:SEC-C motif-containing protein